MKRWIYLSLVVFFLLSLECKLWHKNKNDNSTDAEITNGNDKSNIDFKGLQDKIKNADKMDMDVFMAISVLHKKYIAQFVDETANMNEEEKHNFFESKKKDFFKSMKFNEQEYNSFMEKNIDKLNDYQNIHPEFREYLTTNN
jgi:hypothetical protein